MPVTVVVLGPVSIDLGDTVARPSSGVARALLAALALGGPSGVADASLVEAMWTARGDEVSRSALGVAVHRLRAWLGRTAGDAVAIERTTNGYALALRGAVLDLAEFRRLTARAEGLRAAERPGALEQALAVWRGAPLVDVPPDSLDQAYLARLEQERIAVTAEYGRTCIAAGTPERAEPLVAELASAHRLNEPLQEVCVDLLAACGRQAEALDVYTRVRRALRDQLGVDPGQGLRDAHLRIVRQQPGAALPAAARPNELPAMVPDFTGRAEQGDRMIAMLRDGTGDGVVISAVEGMGGVGKTTLAVHVAHRLGPDFPDGQLYVDLRGVGGDPAEPGEVLGRFIRALGVDAGSVPAALDERAALYRSLLADRRVLVILDNAADEGQVGPLLPGTGRSRVIATSRARLTALAGARPLELDVLGREQAVELLTRIVGDDRARVERNSIAKLADLCAGLPLALRIAGARLAAKRHWRIADYVARLDERSRLDELTHRGLSVRAAIDLSYEGLGPRAQRLYRLLGLLEAPHLPDWVPGALLDSGDATETVDLLVDARLVDAEARGAGGTVRYRLHDLVREHARERSHAEDPPAVRDAALGRALGGWLSLTDTVVTFVNGPDNTIITGESIRYPLPEPVVTAMLSHGADWLDGERSALVSAVRQAAALDNEMGWELAFRSAVLFQPAHYTDSWQRVIDEAMPATRAAGNRRGLAVMLERLTELACARRDYELARRTVREALDLFEAVGDAHGLGMALRHLSVVCRMTGDYAEAVRTGERAGTLLAEAGDLAGQAHALMVIGAVRYENGDAPAALAKLTEARDVAHEAHYPNVELQSTYWVGLALIDLGRAEEALPLFEKVDQVATAAGSRLAGMYAAHGFGCAYASMGRPAEATRSLGTALHLARQRDDRLTQARVLHALAELGPPAERDRAIALAGQALDLARQVAVPLWIDRCQILLTTLRATSPS